MDDLFKPNAANDDLMLSPKAMAILFDVTVEEFEAQIKGDVFHLPAEWKRTANRRLNEASAATGDESLPAALLYLQNR